VWQMLADVTNVSRLDDSERFWLSWKPAVGAVVAYFVVIFLLQSWMRKREGMSLRLVKLAHNGFLMLLSLAMVLGTAWELLLLILEGVEGSRLYCDSSLMKGKLWMWCYVFYLSKYYELLDTVIMVLGKKPLNVLHVYHHSAMVFLCLLMMQQRMLFFYSGVLINASIHTFMYYYYANASMGREVSWKKHLTTMQMVQFVLVMTTWWPLIPICHFNHSEIFTWAVNQLLMISFLLLFLQFYQRTYSGKPKKQE